MTLPDGGVWVHRYTSTACIHAQMQDRPELHDGCRNTCKYAEDVPESCMCFCHGEVGSQPGQTSWGVDQARDMAKLLLSFVPAGGLPPDLAAQIATAPELFWLRNECQPPGVWKP